MQSTPPLGQSPAVAHLFATPPPPPAHSCQRRVCRCTARGACPGTIAGAGLTFSLNTVRSSLIYGDDR